MPAGRNPKRVAENVGRLRHPPHPEGRRATPAGSGRRRLRVISAQALPPPATDCS
jgi:hypothetical protein